jgi:hypothetical protein
VANQLYNKFKADGQELAHGDIAIVDVSDRCSWLNILDTY